MESQKFVHLFRPDPSKLLINGWLRVSIVQGDITKQSVDALVNAENKKL